MVCVRLGALVTTGASADILTLMLTLLGANGASIAVAVASPRNNLLTDFINDHDYLFLFESSSFALRTRSFVSFNTRSASGLKCFGAGELGGFLGLGARLNQLILYVF
jgi:hypothetical protein